MCVCAGSTCDSADVSARVCETIFHLSLDSETTTPPTGYYHIKGSGSALSQLFQRCCVKTATGIIRSLLSPLSSPSHFSVFVLHRGQSWVVFGVVLEDGGEHGGGDNVNLHSSRQRWRGEAGPRRRRRQISASCRPLGLCLRDAVPPAPSTITGSSSSPPRLCHLSSPLKLLSASHCFLLQQIFLFLLPTLKLCRRR